MRILQVVKTNRGATWAYNQAKWLSEHGVEVITVLPSDREGYAEKYKESGMAVVCGDWSLPMSRPWLFFRRAKQIREAVKELHPDLIHLHFVTNVLMARMALRRDTTPRLFQVPGPLHLESRFFNFLERFVATPSDYWAGACQKTCSIYRQKGIEKDRVYLAYYGNSPVDQTSIDRLDKRIHQEYGISDQKKLVAMVSYFYKPKRYLGQTRGLKGHEDFIDAMEIVLRSHPEACAVIIGNAWEGAEKYEKQVKSYGEKKLGEHVIFTGYRNDVKDIYHEFDLAVHPSHSENLGGAAESLAYGVPTIATNIGGFPDIVIPNETGALVPPKDPVSLAQNICYMLEHPEKAEEMAARGRAFVNELLDLDNTAGKIKEIYETIVLN